LSAGGARNSLSTLTQTAPDLAGGEQDSFFSVWNRSEFFGDRSALLYPHAAFQDYDVFHQACQPASELVHMASSFGQKDGGTPGEVQWPDLNAVG